MTDFNYSTYPISTIQTAIDNAEYNIKHLQNLIKLGNKKLDRRRGFSKVQLENLAWNMSYHACQISTLQEEIDECLAELNKREAIR